MSNNALDIVRAVNTVVQLLAELGLNWKDLGRAVDSAKAAGREFGVQDIEAFAARAHKSLTDLDAAIGAAKPTATLTLNVSDLDARIAAAVETVLGDGGAVRDDPPKPE